MSYSRYSSYDTYSFRDTLGIKAVWHAFLTLDDKQLVSFFDKYRIAYGENAYKYAIKQYPLWRSDPIRGTTPAKSTLYRILSIIPNILYEEQRQSILKIWLDSVLDMLPRDISEKESNYYGYRNNQDIVITDWSHFHSAIKQVYDAIADEYQNYKPRQWIDRSNMSKIFPTEYQYIKNIVDLHYKKLTDLCFQNAIHALLTFEKRCSNLQANKMVYSPASVEITTPCMVHIIRVKAESSNPITKCIKFILGN